MLLSRCKEIDNYLDTADYSAPLPFEMAQHLSGCAGCRHRWEKLGKTYRLLTQAASEETGIVLDENTVWKGMTERMSDRARHRRERVRNEKIFGYATVVLSLLALVCILITLYLNNTSLFDRRPYQMQKAPSGQRPPSK